MADGKELITLTDAETDSIIRSTMASYGMPIEALPEEMKAQAREGLKGLLNGLQLLGWTVERPKV